MKKKWTLEDMPDQTGRKIIVTGANSGLGYEATKAFASKGAEVVMACRSLERGEEAMKDLRRELSDPSLELMELDLADLESVENFSEEYKSKYDELHILCNNAGIMAIPRQETEDGFEKQFGVNHLGHFVLTRHLIDQMIETEGETRVVNMSSGAHRGGEIDFEDINHEEDYGKWEAYSQSKLANILFTKELQKRLEEAAVDVKAVACHPGYSATNLQYKGPEKEGSKIKKSMMKLFNTVLGQSPSKGVLGMLYCATMPDIQGGEYIGPGGLMNMRGYPDKQEPTDAAQDMETAKRLWEVSEELTGVEFDVEETKTVKTA